MRHHQACQKNLITRTHMMKRENLHKQVVLFTSTYKLWYTHTCIHIHTHTIIIIVTTTLIKK